MTDGMSIPVAEPDIGEREVSAVSSAVQSTWVSSQGEFIDSFESEFAIWVGADHATSASSGTTALHLILEALDIGPGDEVVVPSLTYVATANAVSYTGARPVFVDLDARTWNLDPEAVKRAVTENTAAVIAVHLLGQPCDMERLRSICEEAGVALVEDAAEAIGTVHRGRRAGVLGDAAAFSFYGNKTITTGEGGMVTTQDEELISRVRTLKNHGRTAGEEYWHEEIGYNYRLTNVQAALGVAQLERVDELVDRKREIAELYRELVDSRHLQHPPRPSDGIDSCWMSSVRLSGPLADRRGEMRHRLRSRGIETRPMFSVVPSLPPYREDETYPVAQRASTTGLMLPSGTTLADEQIRYICDSITEIEEEMR